MEPPQPPGASTQPATNVGPSTATLNGTVNPNSADTHYLFEYGTTTAYGSTTASTDAGSGTSPVPVSANLTGLAPSTTYHFQLVATNSGGTTDGGDLTFATAPPPAPTVTGVSPSSGPTAGGTPITITGTNFVPGATVVIGQGNGTTGAIAATNVVVASSTKITAVTGGGAKAGTFSVYVITSGGTSGANTGANFTYTGAIPTVSAVSPKSGPYKGGTDITVTGTGFVSGSKVEIGQGSGLGDAIAATNVTVVSPTKITAVTGGGAKAGTFSVYVITSGGLAGPTPEPTSPTYQPPPRSPRLVPHRFDRRKGGTTITITGPTSSPAPRW